MQTRQQFIKGGDDTRFENDFKMDKALELFNNTFWQTYDAGMPVGPIFRKVLQTAAPGDFPGEATDAFWPDGSNDSFDRTKGLDTMRALMWCALDHYNKLSLWSPNWSAHWCRVLVEKYGFSTEQVREIRRRGQTFDF